MCLLLTAPIAACSGGLAADPGLQLTAAQGLRSTALSACEPDRHAAKYVTLLPIQLMCTRQGTDRSRQQAAWRSGNDSNRARWRSAHACAIRMPGLTVHTLGSQPGRSHWVTCGPGRAAAEPALSTVDSKRHTYSSSMPTHAPLT